MGCSMVTVGCSSAGAAMLARYKYGELRLKVFVLNLEYPRIAPFLLLGFN